MIDSLRLYLCIGIPIAIYKVFISPYPIRNCDAIRELFTTLSENINKIRAAFGDNFVEAYKKAKEIKEIIKVKSY